MRKLRRALALVVLGAAIWFFLLPSLILIRMLCDRGLREAEVPDLAFRLHRTLAPRYEAWARERLANGRAAQLSTAQIAETEWPLFGSVFFLQAEEALQEAYERDPGRAAVAPKVYAAGAIDAACELTIDPGHASWVKKHWGEAYLHRQDCFYRALLIAAMTSHARLTGSEKNRAFLRDQVETLAAELDASPHGWIEDYPGECYPSDVLGAITSIALADRVLGTDHRAFVERARRGFERQCLDARVGLPPYAGAAAAGVPTARSRGCGNSYLVWAASVAWPEVGQRWMDRYVEHFWQRRWLFDGFREFPRDAPGAEWYADVDAGPVVAGHGFAACAFGIAAARSTGRFDLAWPLSAEALATGWPLASGTLLAPRLLSSASDAPYLGEAAMLWNFTRMPAKDVAVRTGGALSPYVYVLWLLYVAIGGALLERARRVLVR